MPKLLNVEVMDFKCGVSHTGLLPCFRPFEEERMMIRKFLATIYMEETSDGLLVDIHNVGCSQSKVGRIPVKHGFVLALRVGDTIMTPSEDRGRPRSKPLELALPWFLNLIVDGQFFQLWRKLWCCTLDLTPNDMYGMICRIS